MTDQKEDAIMSISPVRRPEKVSLTANIDASTLQRRRSMNTNALKPILKEKLI